MKASNGIHFENKAQCATAYRRTWQIKASLSRLIQNRDAVIGVVLTTIVLICALFPSQIARFGPNEQDLMRSMRPPVWLEGGSWETPLGTDFLGRDILSRIIHGSRVSLAVGFGGVLLAASIGSTMGISAAYWGGLLDRVVCWIIEIQLGLPYLLFVIAVIGILGPSLGNVVLVLGIANFPVFARMMRGEVLSIKQKEFVEASYAIGSKSTYILRRHIVINTLPTLITVATFEMAAMILYESGLGFLGLSVPPAIPSWGTMLSDGRNHLTTSWWLATFAGLAIMVTSLGINLLGEWLRSALDPSRRTR